MLHILSVISLLFIAVTMLMRANDLRWKKQWYWKVRAVGLVMAGFTPFGIILFSYPTTYEAIFHFGLACVFLTTPNGIPWFKYIFKGEQQ